MYSPLSHPHHHRSSFSSLSPIDARSILFALAQTPRLRLLLADICIDMCPQMRHVSTAIIIKPPSARPEESPISSAVTDGDSLELSPAAKHRTAIPSLLPLIQSPAHLPIGRKLQQPFLSHVGRLRGNHHTMPLLRRVPISMSVFNSQFPFSRDGMLTRVAEIPGLEVHATTS